MKIEVLLAEAIQLLDKHPKTKQVLMAWEKANMEKAQRDMVAGIQEEVTIPEVTVDMVEKMVSYGMVINPRFLYTFFDENGVHISARHSEKGYSTQLDGETEEVFYPSRAEAEKQGFIRAFGKMENKEI